MPVKPLKYIEINSTPSAQIMSNTDVTTYVAQLVGTDFASISGVGSLGVGSLTNGTSIGTWVDTYYPNAVGDHPIDAAAVTVSNTTLYQDVSNGSLTGNILSLIHI